MLLGKRLNARWMSSQVWMSVSLSVSVCACVCVCARTYMLVGWVALFMSCVAQMWIFRAVHEYAFWPPVALILAYLPERIRVRRLPVAPLMSPLSLIACRCLQTSWTT